MSRVITERDALRASLATARAEGVAAGALAMREAAATYVFECRLIGGGNPSSAAIRALPLPADAQAALDRVRADEREACAKIVDCGCEAWDCLLDARAAAIRARGEGGQT